MQRFLARLMLLLLPAGLLHAAPALEGTWSATVEGQPLVVMFGTGGRGTVNGEAMQWQALGALLFVRQGGEVASYQFQLQGTKLLVSGGDFPTPVTLTRGTAAAAVKKPAAVAGGAAAGNAGSGGHELVGKWCLDGDCYTTYWNKPAW